MLLLLLRMKMMKTSLGPEGEVQEPEPVPSGPPA
jgi:hypothetical protein